MTEAQPGEPALEVLHQNRVEESEIDELGHLSVPFYEQRALEASRILLARHGLGSNTLDGQGLSLTLVDTFTRNYREQFLGAPLEVQGGVLDAEGNRITLYQQIVNSEHKELSATFVHGLVLEATETGSPVPLDGSTLAGMAAARIEWPDHGRPRSLDLSRPPFELQLSEGRRRQLASRAPRSIEAEECDSSGRLAPGRFQHLSYSGTAEGSDPVMEWVFELADGRRIGLADLETRNTLLALPRVGDRIQTFSADVALARKTVRRSHWVFNVDTGELVTTGSVVMACLDLEARRAVEITGDLRAMFERRYHPDLC